MAVDIETGSAVTDRRWSISAVTVGNAQLAVVLDPVSQAAAIRATLRAARELVFHNAAYDVPILVRAGLMDAADIAMVADTLVTARMGWPEQTIRNDLGSLADRVLGVGYSDGKHALEDGFKALTGRSKSAMFDELGMSSPAFLAYAAFDVLTTARVHQVLADRVVDRLASVPVPHGDLTVLIEREQQVNRMMLRCSTRGLGVDPDVVDSLVVELRGDADQARGVLAAAGLDPAGSVHQLKRVVVDDLDARGMLPAGWPRLKNGQASADKNWLARVNDPLVDAVTTVAQTERFIDVYADKVDTLTRMGRLHPQVNVLTAVTGRMSYGSPPLQQFPAKVRRMICSDRPLVSLDWSSIEPVVVGNLAGDETLLAGYEAGQDLYLPLAEAIGCTRAIAKTVLLGTLYGQGIPSLAVRLGVDEPTARRLHDELMAAMPAVASMLAKVSAYGSARGWIRTVSGRPIPLPPDRHVPGGFAGYKGINYLVQGSAYDLLAEALIAIEGAGLGDAIFLAVHDEIVVDASAADDVEQIMTTPPQALVSAAVSAGRTRKPVLRVGRSDLGHHWNVKG